MSKEVFDMPALASAEPKKRPVRYDEEGYLVDFDAWDESVARDLARREGVGDLPPDKLASLRFIREHYRKYQFFPILRAVCKNVRKPKDCVEEDFLNPLVAWKLAGLPH